jgi:hypothetical protein
LDDGAARLRINLDQREVEIEGSESFVREWVPRIEGLLDRFDDPAAARPVEQGQAAVARSSPETFGEWIHRLPRSSTDVDRILAAGHFAQTRRTDRSFATGEANGLLTEQGIKVGNPSQCIKQNLMAKRVFKHEGRYRVSQLGIDHLRQLLGADWPG